MAISARGAAELTLGPVLFNWAPEVWRDFYFRIAEEAAVATVYLGEVVCSKREPLFSAVREEVTDRLTAAGKTVVFSTLAQVMHKLDRRSVESICACENVFVEANDASALFHLRGRPHHIGPHINVYNEDTLNLLADNGACSVCVPSEMPASAIAALAPAAAARGVALEAQVFGRMSLALSARCYHARAHGRTRDSCQFVCEQDADGLELKTIEGKPFLAINGIQTLSYTYLNLIAELPRLREIGVSRFRLSPHACDMVDIAAVFRAVLDGSMDTTEAAGRIATATSDAPFSNGFFYRRPGLTRIRPDAE
jgi:collagenase-like PrtC family protease